MIFADAVPSDLSQLWTTLQSFGPAGLAGIAVWFLSQKHEKREKMQIEAHAASFAILAAAHKESTAATDARLGEYLKLERERIALMTQLVERIGALASANQKRGTQ